MGAEVEEPLRLKKRRSEPERGELKSVSLILIQRFLEKRRQEAAPARIGRKKKKKGVEASAKLPSSNPFRFY